MARVDTTTKDGIDLLRVDPRSLTPEELVEHFALMQIMLQANVDHLGEVESSLNWAMLALYGPSRERGKEGDEEGQLSLFGGDPDAEVADDEATADEEAADGANAESDTNTPDTDADASDDDCDATDTKKRPPSGGRRRVNAALPTVTIRLDAPESVTDAAGHELVILGWEETEKVLYIPAQVARLLMLRPRYGYRDTRETVITVPPPPAIKPKGKLSDRMIEEIVVEKFYQGLSLNAILDSFNCLDAEVNASLLSDAVGYAAEFYEAIATAVNNDIFAKELIFADETPMLYYDVEQERYRRGYIHVRTDGSQSAYNFTTSRSQQSITELFQLPPDDDDPWLDGDRGPPKIPKDTHDGDQLIIDGMEEHLPDTRPWIGFLMLDGYAGYNRVCDDGGAIRIACWAHVRRYFYHLRPNPHAQDLVRLINKLFALERQCTAHCEAHSLSHVAASLYRQRMRSEHAQPVIDKIHQTLTDHITNGLQYPNARFTKACNYAFNRWRELTVYLQFGFIPMDNNAAERALRTPVVGRKRFLFFGSEDAGKSAAILYTLMQSCRMQDIDPRAYLTFVTTRIHQASANGQQIDHNDLTPKNCKAQLQQWIEDGRTGTRALTDPLGLGHNYTIDTDRTDARFQAAANVVQLVAEAAGC